MIPESYTPSLNSIGEEACKDMKGFYQEWVERSVTPSALYEAHFYLGLIAWKQKQHDSMLEHFQNAIKAALSLYQERSEKKYITEDAIRSVYPLLLFSAFANSEQKAILQQLPDDIFLNPQQDERLNHFVNYLKNPNANKLEKLETLFTLIVDKSYYLLSMKAFIQGLIAVEEQDDKKIEVAINKLIHIHIKEAIEGYLSQRFEGFMCLWVIALQSYSREHYADIHIDSRYVLNVFPEENELKEDAKRITFYLEGM